MQTFVQAPFGQYWPLHRQRRRRRRRRRKPLLHKSMNREVVVYQRGHTRAHSDSDFYPRDAT